MITKRRLAEIHEAAASYASMDYGRFTGSEVALMAEELYEFRKRAGEETLRDKFAMAAIAALTTTQPGYLPSAVDAYRIADAMLEARET